MMSQTVKAACGFRTAFIAKFISKYTNVYPLIALPILFTFKQNYSSDSLSSSTISTNTIYNIFLSESLGLNPVLLIY